MNFKLKSSLIDFEFQIKNLELSKLVEKNLIIFETKFNHFDENFKNFKCNIKRIRMLHALNLKLNLCN